MLIFIKTLSGKTKTITVEPSHLIESVKTQIQKLEEIPVNEQRLFYQGAQIEDGKRLSDYKIDVSFFLNTTLTISELLDCTIRVVFQNKDSSRFVSVKARNWSNGSKQMRFFHFRTIGNFKKLCACIL